MTANPAVDRVVQLLTNAGYRLRPSPTNIGSLKFSFPAVLTSERSLDLVVVVDTLEESADRIHDALDGLARALDRLSSRRPITVVLVGPPPRPSSVEALARTGRILLVGTPTGENATRAIADAVAVLLPLNLPTVSDSSVRSWEDMEQGLRERIDPELLTPLLKSAPDGADAVRAALRASIAGPFVTGVDA